MTNAECDSGMDTGRPESRWEGLLGSEDRVYRTGIMEKLNLMNTLTKMTIFLKHGTMVNTMFLTWYHGSGG